MNIRKRILLFLCIIGFSVKNYGMEKSEALFQEILEENDLITYRMGSLIVKLHNLSLKKRRELLTFIDCESHFYTMLSLEKHNNLMYQYSNKLNELFDLPQSPQLGTLLLFKVIIKRWSPKILSELVNCGANINNIGEAPIEILRNKPPEQATPLVLAIKLKYRNLVKALLNLNASLEVMDALEVATSGLLRTRDSDKYSKEGKILIACLRFQNRNFSTIEARETSLIKVQQTLKRKHQFNTLSKLKSFAQEAKEDDFTVL